MLPAAKGKVHPGSFTSNWFLVTSNRSFLFKVDEKTKGHRHKETCPQSQDNKWSGYNANSDSLAANIVHISNTLPKKERACQVFAGSGMLKLTKSVPFCCNFCCFFMYVSTPNLADSKQYEDHCPALWRKYAFESKLVLP